ncbi:MAG: PadR family transcriptional regulator [Pseudonocardiales bacterium]|nr:MAG: PadR family transcriptional regulator [Pseudonocardiales bacterium]
MPTLNPTSAALLGLLHDGPMTGGELLAAAKTRLGTLWNITRSQVYRELPVLVRAGHVKLGKSGARAAQPYAITATGKRAFGAWLATPPGVDHLRNPLLLRLGFGRQHTKAQLRSLLADARADHESALAAHRDRLARLRTGTADQFAVATAEYGVAYEKALLKWLDTVPTG